MFQHSTYVKPLGNEEDRRMEVITDSPPTEVVHQAITGRRKMTTEVVTVNTKVDTNTNLTSILKGALSLYMISTSSSVLPSIAFLAFYTY